MIARALDILLQQGPMALFIKVRATLKQRKQYKGYLLAFDKLAGKEDIKRDEARAFQYRPKISIIVPVYNTNVKWLRLCIESVWNQVYDNWELCMVDGGSTKSYVRKVLEGYAKQDIDFIYSDEDKISTRGNRVDSHFKPDWSPDTLYSCNYMGHFSVIPKSIVDGLGGFREEYDGSQDYDLFLRVVERTQRIAHICKVLYHWRMIARSAASSSNAKPYAHMAVKKAIQDSLKRRKVEGEVLAGPSPGFYRVKYKILGNPKVSVIIPIKDEVKYLQKCIQSILYRTEYDNYEILVVDKQSREPQTFRCYEGIWSNRKVSVAKYDEPFNYWKINKYAVCLIDSEYIIFLNQDTEVISTEWLTAMLEHVQREEVGIAGAYSTIRIIRCGMRGL